MRPLLLLVLATLLCASGPARACRPKSVPLDERVASAKGIYLGVVTGQTLTGMERWLLRGEQASSLVYPAEYSLRVAVLERLKGSRRTIVEVPIIDCGSGYAELHDRVVVFRARNSGYYIASEQDVIADVRSQLTRGR